MKCLLPILLFSLLGACSTPEEQAERRAQQEKQDFETCKSYGLRPGGEAFGMCRLQLNLAREQQRYYYEPSPHFYGGYNGIYFHH